MIELSEAEVTKWINGLTAFDADNTVILLSIFAAFGIPKSYLDIGSGTGVMVNTAEKLGVTVNGVDLLPRPNHPKLLQRDLREPLDLGQKFDLVTCIEVAEHLEEMYADTLVDTIVRHAGQRIVFTAAMPGQIGDGHVNTRFADYWRHKFWLRGWQWNDKETYRLTAMLALAQHASHHVEANLQIFSWPVGK